MLNEFIIKLKETDFTGIDGLFTLITFLTPLFMLLFFLAYKIIFSWFHWEKYKRRLLGLIWRKKYILKKAIRTKRHPKPQYIAYLLIFVSLGFLVFWSVNDDYFMRYNEEDAISCYRPNITDGDTLKCNGIRIRLHSIDAPEMEGHCRRGRQCVDGDPYAAKGYLVSITRSNVTCLPIEKDYYGRTVAVCKSEQSDNLSCSMIKSGHAIKRYGNIRC